MAKKKTIEQYEEDIRQLHRSGDFDKLHRRLDKWIEKLDLEFYCPGNENKPYTEEELGYPVFDMPLKQKCGYDQTGDYICYIPRFDMWTGVLWERKELNDIYNTLVHHHERFYRECQRAFEDDRFNYMLIGVEGTFDKFVRHRPNGSKGASIQSRVALVETLPPKFDYFVNFRWHRARKYASRDLVRQNKYWIKYHFKQILGLRDIMVEVA